MANNSLPLSKEQLCQIINQQQTTIQSLLSERQWLIDDYHIQQQDIQKFKQTSIQWETYANALTEELNHARQDLAKLTENHEILKDKYEAVKGMYWEVKEKNDANKALLQYGMDLGRGVFQEGMFFKQSYYQLLEQYRRAWSSAPSQAQTVSESQDPEAYDQSIQSNSLLTFNLLHATSTPPEVVVSPLLTSINSSGSNIFITQGADLSQQPPGSIIISLLPNTFAVDMPNVAGALMSPAEETAQETEIFQTQLTEKEEYSLFSDDIVEQSQLYLKYRRPVTCDERIEDPEISISQSLCEQTQNEVSREKRSKKTGQWIAMRWSVPYLSLQGYLRHWNNVYLACVQPPALRKKNRRGASVIYRW